MENLSRIQKKIVAKISNCKDGAILQTIDNMLDRQNSGKISDGSSTYKSINKNYFHEATENLSELHSEMIKAAEEDIKNGKFLDNEALKKRDTEWMKW